MSKSLTFIIAIMWVRTTVPRLRIDQLMSFCWKILLPLSIVQMVANAFIITYDGPYWLLSLTSGAGAVALVAIIINRAFRRSTKATGLVGAYRAAQVPVQ
jgi:NADH-quinone oxidoreductase subunit H